ncbi:MAG TPA: R3H domain-containing nucleic acid-binding protein [Candidatus Nanopelagicales bacterium]|nr:R3H domain-containing nucleic acid-binding protein [Candidatus Nanopelagicales bacterium]
MSETTETEANIEEKPAAAGPTLEEEGDVAADYLEALLDIIDADGDIDIDVEGERALVSVIEVKSGELSHLVGKDGEVLQALQELTRLAVARETGERSRLMVDIAGFRAEQRRQLQEAARTAIAEAQRTAAPVSMRPMNPFERKVVHDVVAEAGLLSASEGEEPERRVVIRVS